MQKAKYISTYLSSYSYKYFIQIKYLYFINDEQDISDIHVNDSRRERYAIVDNSGICTGSAVYRVLFVWERYRVFLGWHFSRRRR